LIAFSYDISILLFTTPVKNHAWRRDNPNSRTSHIRLCISSCNAIYKLRFTTQIEKTLASLPTIYLALKLKVIFCAQGAIAAVGGNLLVQGREDAKRILKSIYGVIKSGLYVTTEIVSGYEVALVGNMGLASTTEGVPGRSFPIVIYMKFDSDGKISDMTISAVDLQPMTDAIRSAAQTGTVKEK
jgi:hypothetical protein